MIGQHALQFATERCDVGFLLVGQWLTTGAHLESTQAHSRAEAFWELGRINHRVEQFDQVVLNRTRCVDLIGCGQIVQLASQFRDDSGAGIRSAVGTGQQHWHQSRIPAGKEREVRTIWLHRLNHANHVWNVAR